MDPFDRSLQLRAQAAAKRELAPAYGDLAGAAVVDPTSPAAYPPAPKPPGAPRLELFEVFAFGGDGAPGILQAATWTLRLDGYVPDYVCVAVRGDTNASVQLYFGGSASGNPIYVQSGGVIMLPWRLHTQLTISNVGSVTAFGNVFVLDRETARHFFCYPRNA